MPPQSNWEETAYEIGMFLTQDMPWIIPCVFFAGAMFLMLVSGPFLIGWLRNKKWRKDAETWSVREDTPDTHLVKQGTPSMGGIGIVAAAVLSYYTCACILRFYIHATEAELLTLPELLSLRNNWLAFLLLPLFVVLFALLGFLDDWSKASGGGGLRARSKLFAQIALSVLWLLILSFALYQGLYDGNFLSLEGEYWILLAQFVIGVLVIVASSNAVNLTDGIDGLASGLAVQAGLCLCIAGGWNQFWNPYGLEGLSPLFWIALAGACLGFLHFNKHKARVFMGDTGSLAIGSALGAGAILQHAVFLLPFIGFIYFVEMASVMLQVLWFKYTKAQTGEGKRLFRRAPLHHHFELAGWSEWRVVLTFWAVNLVTSAVGLWLWHIGVLPRWP